MTSKLKLLIALLVCSVMTQAAAARIYLVAVGIADYPGTVNDLRVSAHDAETMVWLYGKNADGAQTCLQNETATRTAILSTLTATFAQAEADDIVVFFFSGHGYTGGLVAYDGKLGYDEVRQAMATSRSRHKMIFADACFSGRFRVSKQQGKEAMEAAKKSDVMFFLSSRSNERSIEMKNMHNSLFTAYLQRALRGGADANRDRIITAKELFDYVSAGVSQHSRGRQHPCMWGRFPDDMPVMKWTEKK